MIFNKFINNFKVSKICFGTWMLSQSTKNFKVPKSLSEIKAKQLIDFSLDRGVNFFDTADIYGEGLVEKILGNQIKNHRNKIFVMTKGGIVNNKNDNNFSIKYIKNKLFQSLENLNSDYLDGYQLHNLNSRFNISSLFEYLKEQKQKGIIKSIGFSSRDPLDAFKIVNKYKFDFLQVSFSVFDQRLINSGLLEEAKKKKFFLLTRSPFNSGYLTNKKIKDHFFNKNFINKMRRFKKDNKRMIIFNKDTLEASALRFCMSFNEITSIIVGMVSKSEIIKNCRVNYKNSVEEKEWKINLLKINE